MSKYLLTAIGIAALMFLAGFARGEDLVKIDIKERNGKNSFFINNGERVYIDINVTRAPNSGVRTVLITEVIRQRLNDLSETKTFAPAEVIGGVNFDLVGPDSKVISIALPAFDRVEEQEFNEFLGLTSGKFQKGIYTYKINITGIGCGANPCRTETDLFNNSDSFTIQVKSTKTAIPEIDGWLVVLIGIVIAGTIALRSN